VDFADASLVAVAQSLNIRTIFTLDSHFRIYRTADDGTFDIVPQ
jgi:predicted nucleic acid-binding protein